MSYTAIVARTDNSSLFESFQFVSSHDRGEAFEYARLLVEIRTDMRQRWEADGSLKLVAIIPGYHTAWAK